MLNVVNKKITDKDYGRLFAIIHYRDKQFKVTVGDIIAVEGVEHYQPGDVIRLEKVYCRPKFKKIIAIILIILKFSLKL